MYLLCIFHINILSEQELNFIYNFDIISRMYTLVDQSDK